MGRAVQRGVTSSVCVAVDYRYWYRHRIGGIVEDDLLTAIRKFELDTERWVLEVGGGSGGWRMVEVGGRRG